MTTLQSFLRRFAFKRKGDASNTQAQQTNWSLRQRLLLTVMGAAISFWLTSLSIVVGVAWFATSDVFDDALGEGARLVLQLGTKGKSVAQNNLDSPSTPDHSLKLRMYWQLVSPDGRVLLRGKGTPETAFIPEVPRKKKTTTTVKVGNQLWRVYVRVGRDGMSAQVAQPIKERTKLLNKMAKKLAWPTVGLLLVLGLASWLLIRRLLRPLEDTAKRINAQSPHDLTPVHMHDAPRELQPILDALNALLARLGRALENERRFTTDAAHELRTPLAALRMRIQLIERERTLPDNQLQLLLSDLDRCTALAESLLTLARLEPQTNQAALDMVDLHALLDELEQKIPMPHTHMERALAVSHIHAIPELLAAALRNLIDNAMRYGHEEGRIRIESMPLPQGGIRLAVRDNGTGVTPAQRKRLGERFFRVLGTGKTGNGLGLSIVVRIAELHGAVLHFEDGIDGCGLGVVLDFPETEKNIKKINDPSD